MGGIGGAWGVGLGLQRAQALAPHGRTQALAAYPVLFVAQGHWQPTGAVAAFMEAKDFHQHLFPDRHFRAFRHPHLLPLPGIKASGRHVLKLLVDARPGTQLALNPDQIRLLRHRFLHRSAGLGFWSAGRKGMGERRENDKLKREVFHG